MASPNPPNNIVKFPFQIVGGIDCAPSARSLSTSDLEFLAAHPVRQSNDESSHEAPAPQPAAVRRARKAAEAIAGLQKRGKPRLGEAGLSNGEAEGGDRALHE